MKKNLIAMVRAISTVLLLAGIYHEAGIFTLILAMCIVILFELDSKYKELNNEVLNILIQKHKEKERLL